MTADPSTECEMYSKACTLSRLVAYSIRVSESAGNLIKGILAGGQLNVVEKGSDSAPDPQTEADRAAQYLIVQSLHTKFNKLTIIGEEEHVSKVPVLEGGFHAPALSLSFPSELSSLPEEELVVWVDPLDGTSEIAKGNDKSLSTLQQVTVLIGIAHKDCVVAGVIHQPWYGDAGEGRTVWAVKGLGLHGLAPAKVQPQKIIVTTRSHSNASVDNALEELRRRGLADRVDRMGGAGSKVLRVLEGSAAYVFASAGCKKWDTAAPQAILEEAGGRLTDISGRELRYSASVQKGNSGGVLATAPWVDHDEYLKAIPDELKQQLPEVASKK